MTHEETIKRIQELVPSVMELEFGCEVFVQNYIVSSTILLDRSNFARVESEYPLDIIGYCGSESFTNFNKEHITEILGKPITLAVVLLAISENRQEVIHKYVVTVTEDGFMEDTDMNNYNRVQWNLSKDNFNDQSEETKAFITNLLK